MYTYVKSIGIQKGVNQRWMNIDISSMSMVQLFDKYRKCYIHVTSSAPAVNVYWDFDVLKSRYSNFTGTFTQMLSDLGNTSLQTINSFPNISTKTIVYRDAICAGYKATLVHPLYGENSPIETRVDMALSSKNKVIDYRDFYEHCLVSINGLYHLTDSDFTKNIFVKNAGKSLTVSNMNSIGILSFKDICKIQCVPITSAMLYKNTVTEAYNKSLYVNLNRDLTNKTVLFVIAGYLHTHDSSEITRVSDTAFKFDMANYQYLDRYFEAKNYIDLSSLGLDEVSTNPSQVQIDQITSDSVIEKYFTLSQSFAVILDATDIYVQKHFLARSNIFGMYKSYVLPDKPLVSSTGRHPEYIFQYEDGQYSIKINDNTISNRLYNTAAYRSFLSVADSNTPMVPHSYSNSYLLEIGKDI